MCVANEEVVDSLKMKGVLQEPTNSDFHGGDKNMSHHPMSMQEHLTSTSLLEFKIVYIGKNYTRK